MPDQNINPLTPCCINQILELNSRASLWARIEYFVIVQYKSVKYFLAWRRHKVLSKIYLSLLEKLGFLV